MLLRRWNRPCGVWLGHNGNFGVGQVNAAQPIVDTLEVRFGAEHLGIKFGSMHDSSRGRFVFVLVRKG